MKQVARKLTANTVLFALALTAGAIARGALAFDCLHVPLAVANTVGALVVLVIVSRTRVQSRS